jgi:hypothetical protein
VKHATLSTSAGGTFRQYDGLTDLLALIERNARRAE